MSLWGDNNIHFYIEFLIFRGTVSLVSEVGKMENSDWLITETNIIRHWIELQSSFWPRWNHNYFFFPTVYDTYGKILILKF